MGMALQKQKIASAPLLLVKDVVYGSYVNQYAGNQGILSIDATQLTAYMDKIGILDNDKQSFNDLLFTNLIMSKMTITLSVYEARSFLFKIDKVDIRKISFSDLNNLHKDASIVFNQAFADLKNKFIAKAALEFLDKIGQSIPIEDICEIFQTDVKQMELLLDSSYDKSNIEVIKDFLYLFNNQFVDYDSFFFRNIKNLDYLILFSPESFNYGSKTFLALICCFTLQSRNGCLMLKYFIEYISQRFSTNLIYNTDNRIVESQFTIFNEIIQNDLNLVSLSNGAENAKPNAPSKLGKLSKQKLIPKLVSRGNNGLKINKKFQIGSLAKKKFLIQVEKPFNANKQLKFTNEVMTDQIANLFVESKRIRDVLQMEKISIANKGDRIENVFHFSDKREIISDNRIIKKKLSYDK